VKTKIPTNSIQWVTHCHFLKVSLSGKSYDFGKRRIETEKDVTSRKA